MSHADRLQWDRRHVESGIAPVLQPPPPPPAFAHVEQLFPAEGKALEIACGRGRGAVWLASRGMDYWGVDVSPVAVGLARQLAEISGVGNRCRFDVWDLDNGLPPGDSVDLLFCYLFREPGLDEAIIDRLAHGGTLAIAVLSEVGAGPGEFRAPSGELKRAFRQLDVLESGEEEGMAWLLGRRQG